MLGASRLIQLSPRSFRARVALIAGIGVAAALVMLFVPPIPQNPRYHAFADQRKILGVPNFFDVVSNAPFAALGAMGLALVLRGRRSEGDAATPRFANEGERRAFAVLFAGAALLALGSGYYHLAPDNKRLVWDRLPMSILFMALFSITIGDRVHPRAGRSLLAPLLAAGVGSVFLWRATGDLRAYGLVQFYPALAVPMMMLLLPPRFKGSRELALALGLYAVAKICELLDDEIYALGNVVSGHTLKHLAAAGSVYYLYRMAAQRRPLEASEGDLESTPAPAGASQT
jgi:hypothetical protein